MKKSAKKLVVELLRDYPNIPNRIKQREEDIKHPFIPRDENVGGGKAQYKQNNPTENLVITLHDDLRLKRLKDEYDAIKLTYDEADKDTQTIISELYFKRHPTYSMEGLVVNGLIHCKVTAGYSYVNDFIAQVAEYLQLDIY